MKKGEVFTSFMIVGSVMAFCCVSSFLRILEETKGHPLQDIMVTKDDNSEKGNVNEKNVLSANLEDKQQITTVSNGVITKKFDKALQAVTPFTMNIEEIIERVGGFGPFQLTLVAAVYGARLVMSWGMMLMSFAGVAPDWWCIPSDSPGESGDLLNISFRDNTTFEKCSSNSSSCTVVYSDDMDTIVSAWHLICDMDKVPATITSIQMAGVLVGALAGGQSADVFGRKKTCFFSIAVHGVSNIVAAFSNSWQMFAALHFFIGFGIGIYLAVSYTYVVESFGIRWRSVLIAFPVWLIGNSVFALSAWLRPNWFYQHVIVGVLHIPFLLGWFVVPESLRWLTVQGHVEEAEKVVDQMSRYNRKVKPDNTAQILKQVAEEEKTRRASSRKYTYIDIYRGWKLFLKSIVIQFCWTCMNLVYYGIAFGAGKLSGNLYLNIFLLNLVEVPGTLSLHYLSNRFGRRWTVFMYLLLAALSAFSITVVSVYVLSESKGVIITVLALICKLGVGTGWGGFITLTSESYPTVIRNLGAGAANTVSRVGGIIAPLVFGMKKGDVFTPFMIVGSVMAFTSVLPFLLEETKDRPLQDTLVTNNDNSDKAKVNGKNVLSADLDTKQQITTVSNGVVTTKF